MLTMESLPQHPYEAIVVENAPLGVAAGVAAQCFTVAVNSGPLPDSALAEQGANIVLPDMLTLASNFEQLLEEAGKQ